MHKIMGSLESTSYIIFFLQKSDDWFDSYGHKLVVWKWMDFKMVGLAHERSFIVEDTPSISKLLLFSNGISNQRNKT